MGAVGIQEKRELQNADAFDPGDGGILNFAVGFVGAFFGDFLGKQKVTKDDQRVEGRWYEYGNCARCITAPSSYAAFVVLESLYFPPTFVLMKYLAGFDAAHLLAAGR